MNQSRLIIFCRNPQLGKVKTRLAATLGEAGALAVYLHLVNHTQAITSPLQVNKIVYYTDHVDLEDSWENKTYQKALQQRGNLGEKMQHAFQDAFDEGYQRVCIIGTDCFELDHPMLNKAFNCLKDCDAVIGPATDGGYYLLGMRQLHPQVFINKSWSTETVAADTLQDFKSLGLRVATLPVLNDIDKETDLPPEWRNWLR